MMIIQARAPVPHFQPVPRAGLQPVALRGLRLPHPGARGWPKSGQKVIKKWSKVVIPWSNRGRIVVKMDSAPPQAPTSLGGLRLPHLGARSQPRSNGIDLGAKGGQRVVRMRVNQNGQTARRGLPPPPHYNSEYI